MLEWVLNRPLEISLQIYQKNLVLILFIKEYYVGLREYNFSSTPTWTKMNIKSTYKKYLLYNEKEQNVKNINIVFEPRQLFDLCKNFMDLCHPRHPRQNFMNPCYPCKPRRPRNRALTLPTSPTHPRYPRHPRCLANLFKR